MIVTAREKEMTFYLLDKYGIKFINISSHKKNILSKLINYIFRWKKLYLLCRQEKPDASMGIGDFILPQIGWLLHFKSIVFTDIESVPHDSFLTFPFASVIITPKSYKKKLGKKHVRLNSYKELSYINNYFVPKSSVLDEIGVKPSEKFILVRFVSHSAVHDIGYCGITDKLKIKIVNGLKHHAKLFISSEETLPEKLKKFRMNINPEKIHSVMFYAALLFGESSTMAAEAALMGTPSIFIDKTGRGYTDEIAMESGLIHNFSLQNNGLKLSINKSIDIIRFDRKKRYSAIKKDDICEPIINIIVNHEIPA